MAVEVKVQREASLVKAKLPSAGANDASRLVYATDSRWNVA